MHESQMWPQPYCGQSIGSTVEVPNWSNGEQRSNRDRLKHAVAGDISVQSLYKFSTFFI
uniref:Uncharacterized protein n=1 Tax=Arundo donax TaxID=35708 RepID=A0A0A8ZLY4_ARUDO